MRIWLKCLKRIPFVVLLAFAAAWLTPQTSFAQQFNLYEGAGNPFLLLLREPAVWDELKLSGKQRDDLRTLNARIDGPLLAMRNWPAEAADKKFRELLAETESGIADILTREQRQRVRQIQLRVRGIECVGDEAVAQALKLDEKQLDAVRKVIRETQQAIAELRKQMQAGKPREPLEQKFSQLRSDEQKQILAEFTAKQREQLTALVGRSFDVKQLGRVSFKAPELIAGGEWLNSPPLTLAKLRGKVVAIHLWTFG